MLRLLRWIDVRRFWALDESATFLNHGSFGSCPIPVLEVQSELRRRTEAEPVHFLDGELEYLLDAARAALGNFVGAQISTISILSLRPVSLACPAGRPAEFGTLASERGAAAQRHRYRFLYVPSLRRKTRRIVTSSSAS